MTAELCACCQQRPTPDGYACQHCANRAAGHLAAIVELTGDARLVAAGLVRRGRGGAGGKPGSRPPLNDGATDVLDAVTNALTTLARDIAETRGSQSVSKRSKWRTQPDPLVSAARALLAQLEWMRHATDEQGEPYAVAAFAEIAQCAGRVRSLVNGPAESKYLGPCGAERVDVVPLSDGEGSWDLTEVVADQPCDGDIYAPRGGSRGRCRTCGAEVATVDREAWLDGEVRAHAFPARAIADAHGVNVKTIRTWANRGQLKSYWCTDGGLVIPWTDPPEGETRERLHYVGDVLDLAAADKARLAGDQAKRARRAADRGAANERMSA